MDLRRSAQSLNPRALGEAAWRERNELAGDKREGARRLRRFAHNLRRESIFFIFLLVTH